MKVNFYATLRDITGGKEIEIPVEQGITARDLLRCNYHPLPGNAEGAFTARWAPLRSRPLCH